MSEQIAVFTADTASTEDGLVVVFTNDSATDQSTTEARYKLPGDYSVILTVTGPNESRFVARRNYTIAEPPENPEPGPADGDLFVCAVSGADDNAGSWDAPLATVQAAVDAAQPGDVVYVRGGVYLEHVQIRTPGLTLRAYPGEAPWIRGAYALPDFPYDVEADNGLGFTYRGLVEILADGVTWDGIGVLESKGRGIRMAAHNVTVQNCHIAHNRSGGVNCVYHGEYEILDGVTVRNVVAYDCNNYLEGATTKPTWTAGIMVKYCRNATVERCVCTGRGEGIIFAAVEAGTIRANTVYDNTNTAILMNYCRDTTCTQNFVYTSAGVVPADGIKIALDSDIAYPGYVSEANTVTNNIVVGRRQGFGYAVYDADAPAAAGGLVDCLIANNTFVLANMNGLCPESALRALLYVPAKGVVSGTRFINNVFMQDNSLAALVSGGALTACQYDHNCWYPFAPAFAGDGHLEADPLLKNPWADLAPDEGYALDYMLSQDSPCVMRGVALETVAVDFWDYPRSDPPDIGVHEIA